MDNWLGVVLRERIFWDESDLSDFSDGSDGESRAENAEDAERNFFGCGLG